MSPYIFVIATVLAIIPILIIYKVTIERIKEDPTQVGKAQIQFFILVALSEVIPLILIAFGVANLVPVTNIEELYIPAIIIFFTVGFATLFIFLQRVFDVNEEIKGTVQSFVMISLGITSTIPLASAFFLFMMMP